MAPMPCLAMLTGLFSVYDSIIVQKYPGISHFGQSCHVCLHLNIGQSSEVCISNLTLSYNKF